MTEPFDIPDLTAEEHALLDAWDRHNAVRIDETAAAFATRLAAVCRASDASIRPAIAALLPTSLRKQILQRSDALQR